MTLARRGQRLSANRKLLAWAMLRKPQSNRVPPTHAKHAPDMICPSLWEDGVGEAREACVWRRNGGELCSNIALFGKTEQCVAGARSVIAGTAGTAPSAQASTLFAS
jgi:hypothetical protein